MSNFFFDHHILIFFSLFSHHNFAPLSKPFKRQSKIPS